MASRTLASGGRSGGSNRGGTTSRSGGDDIPTILGHLGARAPNSETDANTEQDIASEKGDSDQEEAPPPTTSPSMFSWFIIQPFPKPSDEADFVLWYNGRVRAFWGASIFAWGLSFGLILRYNHPAHLLLSLFLASSGLKGLMECFLEPPPSGSGGVDDERPAPPAWVRLLVGWMPNVVWAIMVMCMGTIAVTALLPNALAEQEIAELHERLEANKGWMPMAFTAPGLAMGMQPLHMRLELRTLLLMLALREVQVLTYAAAPLAILRLTWFTWWQPFLVGVGLALPAESLARQLWTGHVKLLREVGSLHAHVATLESTRRESLIRQRTPPTATRRLTPRKVASPLSRGADASGGGGSSVDVHGLAPIGERRVMRPHI